MLRCLLAILYLSVCYKITAQTGDVLKELSSIRKAYLAARDLTFEVSAYSYKTPNDKKPELVSSGMVKKNRRKVLFQFYEFCFNNNTG